MPLFGVREVRSPLQKQCHAMQCDCEAIQKDCEASQWQCQASQKDCDRSHWQYEAIQKDCDGLPKDCDRSHWQYEAMQRVLSAANQTQLFTIPSHPFFQHNQAASRSEGAECQAICPRT